MQAPRMSRSDFKSCNKFRRAVHLTWIVVRYTAGRRNGWWRRESMEAARVESDSRNESGAKDRVDSPEQVAGDLERGRGGAERRVAGGGPVSPWRLDPDTRTGTEGRRVQRQTSGCMRQVHTSSRRRAIQRLSTIQTRLSHSFVPSTPSFPAARHHSSFIFFLSLFLSRSSLTWELG